MFTNIILAFIPVFVAVDAIGLLPIFLSMTQSLSKKQRVKIIFRSMQTAIGLAIGFVFLGKWIFSVLGITVGDFMIAGGVILFCISILDLVFYNDRKKVMNKDLGMVPLGTPLIVGPAVLTTSLIIIDQYGIIPTLISVIGNVILTGLIFASSSFIIKIIGKSGTKVLSKLMSLLLAAISIMMIRKGIIYIIASFSGK